MEYANILRHYGALGFFELPDLLTFTGEKKRTVLQTLYRWNKKGWIIAIRRGFYAIPEDLAKNPLTAERAANHVKKATYVTGLWRLNQLGLIPEGVTVVTNATRDHPAEFETPIGRFAYQHIQAQGFFGYEEKPDGGGINVQVATPEKALLDFFWWKNVEWTDTEFERWRIQDPFHRLNHKRLKEFAKRWDQPRLIRAVENVTAFLNAA